MGLNLVTRAEYKAYAGITSATQDVIIDSIIPKVSELVKSICNRKFLDHVEESLVEYYDGGTNSFALNEYPVLSVESVEYSSDFGNTYIPLVPFVDYALNIRTDSIMSISGREFPYKHNSFKITYTAGYEELPADLKLCILDLITYYIRNDMAIHSNRAPGGNTVQIEYVTNTNLPAHIKRVLDLYTSSFL